MKRCSFSSILKYYYTTALEKVKNGGVNKKKVPLPKATGLLANWVGKKRGQKEADHGFRRPSAISINLPFEQGLSKMKTKVDKIMNGLPGRPK
jgi:hypothetical protein